MLYLNLAGVDSGGIQNEIHDMMTIRTEGMYVEKNRKPGFLRSLKTAARQVKVPGILVVIRYLKC